MGRLSQTFKVGLAFLFAVLSTNLLPVYASALTAPGTTTQTAKVNICHSDGQSGKYSINDIDTSAVDEYNNTGKNGHGDHTADIIPPFVGYPDGVVFAGKNWSTANQEIYANDCNVIESDVPATPTVNAIGKCGEYGNVVLPIDTDTIKYSISPTSPTQGSFTVTANPATGVVLDVDGTDYTLGQNGKATYEGDLGEYSRCPVISTLDECESFELIEATNKDLNGWTLGENASFVDGGMKLDVTGGWDSTAITRTLSGDLSDLGTGIDYAPEDQYLGLHVKTSAGTLTYEKFYENQDSANTGKWWSNSNFNVASGMGYATFDTLEKIVAANPGVTLENVRVLYTHPAVSTVTVTSVKIGCKEYVFDYVRDVKACTLKDETYRDTWTYDGNTYPDAQDYEGIVNNATYQFTNEGLHLSTPDTDSTVYGMMNADRTPLADVDFMSYKTYRKSMSAGYEQTHPAYILYVDINGSDAGGEKYFFYEPYNNSANAAIEDTWQTWDAIAGGNAKWWMSGTGQALQTWNYFVNVYPEAVVLAYGFNQGTYNAETYSIVQDVEFDRATTSFAAPNVMGDTTTKPVVPSTPAVLATTVALPAELPATGSRSNQSSLILMTAVILGVLTYLTALRRQNV